ncbi:hypothetical protein K504DRAFT_379349 [Pleomassaria siparia CBS 279.74]|uniref:Alpha/beta-hydrolase n=1 Tax=Pleomassaria siparia CBS 279.74 TaxID=1314801 RepID=A0A6G1K9W8_9PLEO|nr:hypothetical protein K504DRAFT_379349 [Pleomassaria siparia CBS 279.74]
MPAPSEPTYSFTLPSIHDDTALDCRIYHPLIFSQPQRRDLANSKEWRNKGIVMAHPYAPMGGSYDDRVVGMVVEEFLKLGFVVGTFNFRGAQGSKAHTSWSGKPEIGDYMSFAAFFMHYLSYLHPFPSASTTFTPEQSPLSGSAPMQPHDQDSPSCIPSKESVLVILGGYSYGSHILRHLPPVPSILSPFSVPASGTAAAEILLRAHRLGDQSNLDWINAARDHARQSHSRASLGVVMGGEETSPEKRRSSREMRRRSMDRDREGASVRRSLDLGIRIHSLSHRRGVKKDKFLETSVNSTPDTGAVGSISMPEVRYLLISPLAAPVSTVVAPGLGQKFWSREKEGKELVGKHVALAVYGDQDIFTSAKRTREWAERMGGQPGSKFEHVEIVGAGHFWHEVGAEDKLRATLRDWEGVVS